MNEKTQVQVVNEEINRELADPKTGQALLATTFKGLTAVTMKQAILEGMLLGFSFKNFLQRDIYAIPFKNFRSGEIGYSLITSIGHARKVGQKAGQCGKKAPEYTYQDQEVGTKKVPKVESCSVTVQKQMPNGYIGDYTATVDFDEYNTGKNNWLTKPKTMIAKVAEMHALRSAFPEQLDKVYVEEELDKGSRISEVSTMVEDKSLNMGNFAVANDKKDKDPEITKENLDVPSNPFDQGKG